MSGWRDIDEVGSIDDPVRFAAGELSHGVWGFYVPASARGTGTLAFMPGICIVRNAAKAMCAGNNQLGVPCGFE